MLVKDDDVMTSQVAGIKYDDVMTSQVTGVL